MLSAVKTTLRARATGRRVRLVEEQLAGETLALADVGAAFGVEPRWAPFARYLDYIGFEPDARAYANLKHGGAFHSYEVIPKALWSRAGPLDINVCQEHGCSSHFPPNMSLMSQFPRPERIEVVGKATVDAITLDSVMQGRKCDFIKVDTQGGELEILKGATRTLQDCIGLELEVEFTPIYHGVPLFGDLCAFMSDAGFEFVDFTHLCRWERDGFTEVGRCIFGDALFLRTQPVDSPRYRAILAIYDRLDSLQALTGSKSVAARRAAAKAKRRVAAFVANVLDVI